MSEEQIERLAEKQMDVLDNLLLTGKITDDQYDERVSALEKWCGEQYALLHRLNCALQTIH